MVAVLESSSVFVIESCGLKRFVLERTEDVSGVSGCGIVAEGVEFSDGRVALRWLGMFASTVLHDNVETLLAVHGHGGRTRVRWVD